jgi:hypothetical protein
LARVVDSVMEGPLWERRLRGRERKSVCRARRQERLEFPHEDRHGRIVHAFRGQWNVEELFRRAKKGGRVP